MQDFIIKEYQDNTHKIAFDEIEKRYNTHFVDWLADRELNVSALGKLEISSGDMIVAKMPGTATDHDYQTVIENLGPLFKDNKVIAVPDSIRFEHLTDDNLKKIGLIRRTITSP